MLRMLSLILVSLLLLGQTSTTWNMTIPPNPIEILYNATNITKPDAGPVAKIVESLHLGNKTTTTCKRPSKILSFDFVKYIACKIKEEVSNLFSWIKDKIKKAPIIGAVVEFFDVFGGMMLQLIFNIGWLLYNIGTAMITAASTVVEIVIWFFTLVSTYMVDIVPWIPWIVLVLFFATFVDSANRAAKERSLFPLWSFVSLWLDFFERIYRLFEKLFKLVVGIIKLILDVVKPI